MSNTIKVQSAGVPALFFIINELGEKVGQEWQEGGALDAHAKAQIEQREYALYFDAGGVLELHKWLTLHKERKAAYQANNRACEAFNQEHGVKALEAENIALHDALCAAELCVCFAPAKTLHDLALKAEIVAQVCDPIRGECGFERAILDGMTRDTTRLAIQHLNFVQEVISEGAE